MTSDERIEALTQNVQLLVAMHHDFENRHDEQMAALSGGINRLVDISNKIVDISSKLTQIADDHEHRIRNLEQ